ncbi:MAG: hypothetical protein J6C33_05525, partial [Lachnospiraceae bacterium]|nr:hypothetical protein [Lachnospiraceae bacterium]
INSNIADLGKSVADGKTAVAAAISAKGVNTAADATFDTMAANISEIGNAEYLGGKTGERTASSTSTYTISTTINTGNHDKIVVMGCIVSQTESNPACSGKAGATSLFTGSTASASGKNMCRGSGAKIITVSKNTNIEISVTQGGSSGNICAVYGCVYAYGI